MRNAFLLFLFLFFSKFLFSQTGIIRGKVLDAISNEPVPFAGIVLQGTIYAATSSEEGFFEIKNIVPGAYNVLAQAVGFKKTTLFEIEVSNTAPVVLSIIMQENAAEISDVIIVANPFVKKEESPLSMHTLGSSEIKRNPGGNRDISKVIQSLPGVASTPSFRNDIIIRGGAPNENRFYLDGVEVPNINHFSTQGSSGGPVGMINVDFIREVDFYSGSFPANKGNALSSVFEFKQRDGNSEKHVFTSTIGASDLGITAEGPIGKSTSFIFSLRRSYLQFLFSAIGLPFLPTYNDAQFKVKLRLSAKDELTFIGLGAIDDFVLNLDANETESQQYFLNNIPVNKQWNYSGGATYKHFREKSYLTLVVSRNHLNNRAYKYLNNDDSSPSNKILDYKSSETENKVRVENTWRNGGLKINYGLGFENVLYTNSTFSKKVLPTGVSTFDFSSKLTFNKYAAFAQLSKSVAKDKLTLSFGIRTDAADYSAQMSDLVDQISPRMALSWTFAKKISFNLSAGRYSQLPAYTAMGYRDQSGALVNKSNKVTYIYVNQLSSGFEYLLNENTRITIEGFFKQYSNYPFLVDDSISLANLGSDFGVIGNSEVVSSSKGRAKGVEFLIQRKLLKNIYGIFSYTYVYSEFTDKMGRYIPSSWDNRHVINLVGGKKFKRNWEAGFKWRFLGGAPYTPYNVPLSSQQEVWNVTGQGVPDYSLLNTKRLPSVHQLDMRVDKKYYFKKWMLEFYVDIQNIYNFKAILPSYLTVVRDDNGMALVDPNDPNAYQMKFLENTSGTVLPTIGLAIEF